MSEQTHKHEHCPNHKNDQVSPALTDINDCCSFSSFSVDDFTHLIDRFTKMIIELPSFPDSTYPEQCFLRLALKSSNTSLRPFQHPLN